MSCFLIIPGTDLDHRGPDHEGNKSPIDRKVDLIFRITRILFSGYGAYVWLRFFPRR
jgi:hypothetical protein